MDLKDRVVDYFIMETGIKAIQFNTNIADVRYKIFDIDAEVLMENFFKKFEVNCNGFVIDEYFYYPEYSWKELFFFKFLFKKKQYPVLKDLPISHLIEVVKRKEWFEPKDSE